MPAKSESMANLARMALAYKHGHDLDISKAGMAKVRSMAQMSDKQLQDFARSVKRKKQG